MITKLISRRMVIPSVLISLTIAGISPAIAEVEAEDIVPAVAFSAPAPLQQITSADTTKLQARVLMRINEALTKGAISPAEASNLKEKLNYWSNKESWYISLNKPVPQSLVQEDIDLISQMNAEIDHKQAPKPASQSANTLHMNLDELIGDALAHNKITSLQAERYYSRLADVESDLESLNSDTSLNSDELAAARHSLAKLESEVRIAAHM